MSQLNETLRRGLSAPAPRATWATPFRADTFQSAFRPGVDPQRLNQLVDDSEVNGIPGDTDDHSGCQLARLRAQRIGSKTVRIYFGTELIKVHPRQPPGGRYTDPRDYPVGKAAYALRSVDALLAKAKEKGLHVGLFAERILAGPLQWARMRQGYSLLRLCDKYGVGHVEAVCQSALAFDVIDVGRIARMLKSATRPKLTDETQGKLVSITSAPRFARSVEHFTTRSNKERGQ